MQQNENLYYRSPTGKVIPVTVADTFTNRFLGLMGRQEGLYGLLLSPCDSIHTCFMRYQLDAAFLDKNNQVLAIRRCLKPFSVVTPVKGAKTVLEFPSSLHAFAFLIPGTEIKFD